MLTLLDVIEKAASSATVETRPAGIRAAFKNLDKRRNNKVMPWQSGRKPSALDIRPKKKPPEEALLDKQSSSAQEMMQTGGSEQRERRKRLLLKAKRRSTPPAVIKAATGYTDLGSPSVPGAGPGSSFGARLSKGMADRDRLGDYKKMIADQEEQARQAEGNYSGEDTWGSFGREMLGSNIGNLVVGDIDSAERAMKDRQANRSWSDWARSVPALGIDAVTWGLGGIGLGRLAGMAGLDYAANQIGGQNRVRLTDALGGGAMVGDTAYKTRQAGNQNQNVYNKYQQMAQSETDPTKKQRWEQLAQNSRQGQRGWGGWASEMWNG